MLVIIIAFILVIPAAAKGPGPGGNGPNSPEGTYGAQTAFSQMQQGPRQTFAMAGTIAEINPDLMTIIINIVNGNKLVQESGFEVKEVMVVETTRFLLQTGRIGTPITFDSLKGGQQDSVNGVVSVEDEIETWTAYRITASAYLTQTHKR